MIKLSDTIAAVATGMNQGGIGIIRVSGESAILIVDKIFKPKYEGKEVRNLNSYTAAYGNIVRYFTNEKKEFEDKSSNYQIIDEVIVLVMKAPATYTKEDVVEIDCHGGMQVMKEILHLLLQNGVRLAEPGEFTKRAFLNGRIDLSQAESVMDLISAKNNLAVKSAMSQLKGDLRRKIEEMRDNLIHNIAYIESALDDPEHYDLEGFGEKLDSLLENLENDIQHLLITAEDGKIMKEGIRTVILGKPNAGKSSILNVLMGKERAIVTDIAGTTRDILEEYVSINGIPLNISDTAGIRDTEDIVEKIGVDKSLEAVEDADLILYIVDSSVDFDKNDFQIMEKIKDKRVIILKNKSDLENVLTNQYILDRWESCVTRQNMLPQKNSDNVKQEQLPVVIEISAKEHTGFEEFYEQLNTMFFHGSLSYNDEVYITNIRHKEALLEALSSVTLVRQSIADGMTEDFYSIDLMAAYERLGFIIGESVEDDLVDTIFKDFCMGK